MKCQICGATKGLRSDGTIKLHHRKSEVCAGTGQEPWETSCTVLDGEIARLEAAERNWVAWYERYMKGNRPPADAEFEAWRKVSTDLMRLRSRRKRWDQRNWVEYWCDETQRFRKRPPDVAEISI
jgi:hypothetical protein